MMIVCNGCNAVQYVVEYSQYQHHCKKEETK